MRKTLPADSTRDQPHPSAVVCTLQPGEVNTRSEDLLPGLARLARNVLPVEAGYRFQFTPSRDVLNAIATAIDGERQCCRFLRFQLTVEPDGGPVLLDVTGPQGTTAFLNGLLEAP
jgi:hypothetical protein